MRHTEQEITKTRCMNDIELAEYFFPHCMMHWPKDYPKFAKEARQLLKTKGGQTVLMELRNEYEKTRN